MSGLTINSYITSATGLQIPQLGFGNINADALGATEAVKVALQAGYRHFDTAQQYGTEKTLADALARLLPELNIPRSEIFLCTKYDPPTGCEEPGPTVEDALAQMQKSREIFVPTLGYVDLLLFHQPRPGPKGRTRVWEALKQAKAQGWAKEIGVSNFSIKMLEELAAPVPAVNQIEVQPWYQLRPVMDYCQSRGIAIVAFCPLVRSDPRRMNDPVVVEIAKRHGKDVGQVLLRWSLQLGVAPIPRSSNPARIKSNADLYDFELSESDMRALNGLELGKEGACSIKSCELINGP